MRKQGYACDLFFFLSLFSVCRLFSNKWLNYLAAVNIYSIRRRGFWFYFEQRT